MTHATAGAPGSGWMLVATIGIVPGAPPAILEYGPAVDQRFTIVDELLKSKRIRSADPEQSRSPHGSISTFDCFEVSLACVPLIDAMIISARRAAIEPRDDKQARVKQSVCRFANPDSH